MGELVFMECQSGDDYNIVLCCVEKCFILLPKLEFLISKLKWLNSFQPVQPVPGTPPSPRLLPGSL